MYLPLRWQTASRHVYSTVSERGRHERATGLHVHELQTACTTVNTCICAWLYVEAPEFECSSLEHVCLDVIVRGGAWTLMFGQGARVFTVFVRRSAWTYIRGCNTYFWRWFCLQVHGTAYVGLCVAKKNNSWPTEPIKPICSTDEQGMTLNESWKDLFRLGGNVSYPTLAQT